MLKKAPAETPLKKHPLNANLQGGFDPLTSSQGLSSPLLCAPACRPAHLLVCSASPRLAACPAACSARHRLVWLPSCLLRGTTRLCLAAARGTTRLLSPAPESLRHWACTPSAAPPVPVCLLGATSYWGHPLRVERPPTFYFAFAGKKRVNLGADSHFFALLGSTPQELNTTRPEAKLRCWKLHARNPNRFFITLLLSRHSIREWQSFQLFARFFR